MNENQAVHARAGALSPAQPCPLTSLCPWPVDSVLQGCLSSLSMCLLSHCIPELRSLSVIDVFLICEAQSSIPAPTLLPPTPTPHHPALQPHAHTQPLLKKKHSIQVSFHSQITHSIPALCCIFFLRWLDFLTGL